MRRSCIRFTSVLLAGAAAAVGADPALACSCADADARDRLASGQVALIGEVTDVARPFGEPGRITIRIERRFNSRLGGRRTIRLYDPLAGCRVNWREGQRVGAFLYREGGRWTVNLCSSVAPAELIRGTEPYPEPRRAGRLALLAAGGRFGDARLLGLDAEGRLLGYGFGSGRTEALSVCPGSATAVELVTTGRQSTAVVRDLASFAVRRVTRVPVGASSVQCADASATTVHVGVISYSKTGPAVAQVRRLTPSNSQILLSRTGDDVEFGGPTAAISDRGKIVAVNLTTGASEVVLRTPFANQPAVSPDGRHIAAVLRRGIGIVPSDGGSLLAISPGRPGSPAWISPDRLLVSQSTGKRIYDSRGDLVRRYPFARAYGTAAVGGRLFGVDRYRLVGLDLASGQRRDLVPLPDPGVGVLVPVPGQPEVDLPRDRPRAGVSAVRSCRAGQPSSGA